VASRPLWSCAAGAELTDARACGEFVLCLMRFPHDLHERNVVSMAWWLQEPSLFADSVRYNIEYGRAGA